jgi:2-dehydro-3-deoxyphosphogluconate aldolase / (4S)-4-hydroxy-2-oxoglutarate aldolase
MEKSDVIRRIVEIGIIPVVRAASPEEALRAVDAVREGGVSILEITMTVPGALKVIEAVVERYGSDSVIGAGTVLDEPSARACISAGARFVVSPALDSSTIACCRRYSVAAIPGALTPTEVLQAWTAGADFVKVFPAGSVGGPGYIKALKAPFPQIELIPTGGVSMKTAADFIKAGACALGVGTDLVSLDALRDGQAALITDRARRFVEIVREARGE